MSGPLRVWAQAYYQQKKDEYDSPGLKADVVKCVAFVEKTAKAPNGQ